MGLVPTSFIIRTSIKCEYNSYVSNIKSLAPMKRAGCITPEVVEFICNTIYGKF